MPRIFFGIACSDNQKAYILIRAVLHMVTIAVTRGMGRDLSGLKHYLAAIIDKGRVAFQYHDQLIFGAMPVTLRRYASDVARTMRRAVR